ncbi:MAG: hypothetical protein HKN82_13595 [Akkermansiaceae bacterium]|nr:hypothetical protein [Akkermansiaceae bacterium]
MHTMKLKKGRSLGAGIAAAFMALGIAGPQSAAQNDQPVGIADLFVNALYELKFGMSHNEFDMQEDYLSGGDESGDVPTPPGMPDPDIWRADYNDPDGWLYGLSTAVALPARCGAVIDFAYRTGDLEGGFTTTELSSGETFPGSADIDRDMWELGVTIPIPSMFFGRVAYRHTEDDVTWNFGGGELEFQEYEWQAIEAGFGMEQETTLGSTGWTLLTHAFVGALYFDLEHTELGSNMGPPTPPLKTDWEGWGYVLRGGADLVYPLGSELSAALGAGYEFMDTSDGDLDLKNYELLLDIGLRGNF